MSVLPRPATIAANGELEGVVVAAHRRHYAVALSDGTEIDCVLKGRSTQLACGDRVRISRVAGGGAIDAVLPRTTLFFRSDANREKLIAANVTQVIGVVAPGLGVDEELVNRWMIAAESQRCRFVLVANKADLPDFNALMARLAPYAALGYAVLALSAKRDAAPLLPMLAGQRTVLIGQSGMGKSTILNAVLPDAGARTGETSTALAAGRHTTSNTTLHRLGASPERGWIVDSPGMKAFGLAHLPPASIEECFVELRPLLGHCRFRDCRHDREPDCALQSAVERRLVAPHRVALLRHLIRESTAARDPAR